MIYINVKKIDESVDLPAYETSSSAGMDVRAFLPNGNIDIAPQQTKLIGTGLIFEIPDGLEIQIRPRSGLALKNSITVLNSPGTIDADYRGEIKVILINHSSKKFTIKPNMRIGQIVFSAIVKVKLILGNVNMFETKRSSKGFGSTGLE